MIELLLFIGRLLNLYIVVLIAAAIFSWLYAFNVVNPHNQFVRMFGQFLYAVTEPVLRPIRRVLPNMGGMDLSPLVVIFIIWFIQQVIIPILIRMFL